MLNARPYRVEHLAHRTRNRLPSVEINGRTLVKEQDLPLYRAVLSGESVPPDKFVKTNNDLMSLADVSEYLNIKPETIRRWLKSGHLKGFKAGNRWRVRQEDLKQYMEERR